jgi:DNA-binding transcriptional LysR family regulator
MDIATLRTFVEVMQLGSFAAVARTHNVVSSSISRAIDSLEAQLGVRLFQRTTRRLAPTEAAVAYYEQIEPLIGQLERAGLMAADSARTTRGTLRITASIAFAQANLVPLLPEFSRRYPELSFEMVLTDKLIDLVDERIDIAIRLGRLADSSLVAHRLCDMVYVVAASPDYLRRRGRPAPPAELEHHECLPYPLADYGARWRFRAPGGLVTEVPVSGRVVVANGIALRQCAVGGMGVVMLPRWNLADELRNGTLVELFTDYQVTASEFEIASWIVYPARSYIPLKVRVFADYLREKFADGPPAETGTVISGVAIARDARARAPLSASREAPRGSRGSRPVRRARSSSGRPD